MKVTRLRLHGFKSFVEPADIPIEPGLTGIVGPNGCGKSNLVEALRFVMGESSYKALRGGGMDDVIFAGSGGRPARNIAEVTLVADSDAPSGEETLEITRRIEREAGSAYRINGRDVRARDVQLLFADAATGPRSSALVRQGQIAEIIAAKPQQRRSLLEDAAGISGLHSRRAEAEGKLKAAEANLERLDDVQNEIAVQLEALRRQARQAARYRTLSAEISRAEALANLVEWESALDRLRHAEAEMARAGAKLAEAAAGQAATARDEAVAAQGLPDLRNRAAAAAAALQRLRLAGDEIEREQVRHKARCEELAARRTQLVADLAHEAEIGNDAAEALRRIEQEQASLEAERDAFAAGLSSAGPAAEEALARSARSEAAFAEASAALATAAAERGARERAVAAARARLAHLGEERTAVLRERAKLESERSQAADFDDLAGRLAEAERTYSRCETQAQAAEAALHSAREAERRARTPVEAAELALAALQAEAHTLAKVLDLGKGKRFAPVTDAIEVAAGYEKALVAALGEDLDLPLDPQAPAFWGGSGPGEGDEPLPAGVEPLSLHVRGPEEIARRLRQIGVVEEDAGAALVASLSAGQILVSRAGALWRWDGVRVKSGASTAAARRLEQRNRVAALVPEMKAARAALEEATELFRTGSTLRSDAESFEKESRDALRAARAALEAARAAMSEAERRASRFGDRIAALTGSLERLDAAEVHARAELAAGEQAVAGLAETAVLAEKRAALQRRLDLDRAAAAEARVAFETASQQDRLRAGRLEELGAEHARWSARAERARKRILETQERLARLESDLAAALGRPDELASRRRKLLDDIAAAESLAADASDRLAQVEGRCRVLGEAARAALEALSRAREEQARDAERVVAASARRDELSRRIGELFGKPPHALRSIAEIGPAAELPQSPALQGRIERLKAERDRLGAVNLRAEEEAAELDTRLATMRAEREDLEGAIRDLRQGIQTLNREGRERLLAAFEEVDGHFRSLFQHLFGGGTAELSLTDSPDALDAGLDIVARPPGKRPQTMSLLSGGEQTLTALSLIFAVFLTNPSPVCVLDEVDAPLDDANVERFCALLEEMRRRTATRFLVVTHNPITMARMDRLFGVTMAERGVSQLVSVDLNTAERFREAS